MYRYYPAHPHQMVKPPHPACWTASSIELNRKLRALWVQHVYWTRLTVNSIVDRLGDEQATTARLLRNPTDFAAVLEPFYGRAIAARFAELLREHLVIAAELVKALQAGNSSAAADAQKRWYMNAEDIADFLSRINPFWSKVEWKTMLDEHLRLLTGEVAARLAKNYEQNVALNDLIEPQAAEMADVMTNGIIQQFPSLFSI
ncbi:acetylglutamate kinase [Paenibacillus sp. FSL H8-0537]|uniref:acetylglutamate kinase n=1 Tax=Paenibacillus sp. FSL H8-0537 TaxID=2921399 RepID=UPI003101B0FD